MLKTLARKIRSFLVFEKPLMIVEAMFLLVFAKLILASLPFTWVVKIMGKPRVDSSIETPIQSPKVYLIRDAIIKADRNIPFETSCYPQAIAGKVMMRKRKLASVLYLGVMQDKSGEPKGHAWLKHGSSFITGYAGHQPYNIIAMYL